MTQLEFNLESSVDMILKPEMSAMKVMDLWSRMNDNSRINLIEDERLDGSDKNHDLLFRLILNENIDPNVLAAAYFKGWSANVLISKEIHNCMGNLLMEITGKFPSQLVGGNLERKKNLGKITSISRYVRKQAESASISV